MKKAIILFLCLFSGIVSAQDLWGGYRVDIKNAAGDTVTNTNLQSIQDFGGIFRKRAGSSTALSSTSLADITGLSFPVLANRVYRYKAYIQYSANATTTGSAFSINGPAGTVTTLVTTPRGTTVLGTEYQNAVNTTNITLSSAFTDRNFGTVEGFVEPTADGTYIIRGAAESGGTITVQAISVIEWYEIK